jgi:hypothetical protein
MFRLLSALAYRVSEALASPHTQRCLGWKSGFDPIKT